MWWQVLFFGQPMWIADKKLRSARVVHGLTTQTTAKPTCAGAFAVDEPLSTHLPFPVFSAVDHLANRRGWSRRFVRGWGEAGFLEGRNAIIAFRWAEGHYDRLPTLAAELVQLRVAVLFTGGGPLSAFAAKACHPDYSDSLFGCHRPGPDRARHQSQSAWWKRHRHEHPPV